MKVGVLHSLILTLAAVALPAAAAAEHEAPTKRGLTIKLPADLPYNVAQPVS